LPDEQLEQIFSPMAVVSLNCPAKQSLHDVLPSVAKRPAPQALHSLVLFLANEYVFAAQSLQVVALVSSLYSPLAQGTHDVCSATDCAYPFGHRLQDFKLDESV